MTGPNAAVAAAIARRKGEAPSEDTLEKIRAKAKEAKNIELDITDLEEQIKRLNARLHQIIFSELVDMMANAKVDALEVAAEGNRAAFNARLKPYYSASIPADAPEEKRIAAFAMLEANKAADIIKTIVTVNFPKEERKAVAAFIKKLPKGVTHDVKASVHKGTLTKWLRERVESGGVVPPLEPINGVVGRTVELKDIKEK